MKIEEILSKHGIEDGATIEAIKADMPANFLPLEEHNKRLAAAKKEAEEVKATLEAEKAKASEAVKAAQAEAEAKANKAVEELEALKKEREELGEKLNETRHTIHERDAKEALQKAITGAGANPAAIGVLTANALSSVEYGEDGKATNVEAITEKLKADNAGLFGEPVDTGKEPAKADDKNGAEDRFAKGFGL